MAKLTDYRIEYCSRVINMGMEGKSVVAMAVSLGFVRKTLYNWADKHPEFKEALDYAKEASQAYYEELGKQGMMMGKDFNGGVWSRIMGARFREDYGKQNDPTVQVTNNVISSEPLTDVEWERQYTPLIEGEYHDMQE